MTGPGEPGRSFWERSVVGWHAAFYWVLGVVAVLLLLEPDPETPYAVTLALLAVMGGSYWVWGRPALGRDDPRLALPTSSRPGSPSSPSSVPSPVRSSCSSC